MQIQFRINTFTVDEWPMQEPDCFDHFSVGEEQSTSVVTALAWSPPGLAMHKRSVLAVLTSNLVVSFWASVADPLVAASWQRVFVLNNAVKKSWERRCLSKHLPTLTENQLRRKSRIRSLAWAPRIRQWPEKYQHSVETKWGMFLLAVANDDGEVVFLLISSPFTTESTSWDSHIVKLISLDGRDSPGGGFATKDIIVPESRNGDSISDSLSKARLDDRSSGRSIGTRHDRPSLFSSAVRRNVYIDQIAWGPWKFNADAETIVTFTRGGEVCHCIFHVSFPFPVNTRFSSVPRFRLEYISQRNSQSFDITDRTVVWHSHVSMIFRSSCGTQQVLKSVDCL